MNSGLSIEQLLTELRKRYQEKKLRNPAYSLRTFARTLGINESTLQKVFRNERQLGRLVAEKIANRLALKLRPPERTSRKRLAFTEGDPIQERLHRLSSPLLTLILVGLAEHSIPDADIEKFCHERMGYSHEQIKQALLEAKTSPEPIRSFGELADLQRDLARRTFPSLPLRESFEGLSPLVLCLSVEELSEVRRKLLEFRRDLEQRVSSVDVADGRNRNEVCFLQFHLLSMGLIGS